MKLTIKNFARIKEAEINIDGITIIAGENNTGKTTVGKVLFSCFNSLSNIEEKILSDKKFSVENEMLSLYKSLLNWIIISGQNLTPFDEINDISDNLYTGYLNHNLYDVLISILKEYIDTENKNAIKLIKKTTKKIEEYFNIPDERIFQ